MVQQSPLTLVTPVLTDKQIDLFAFLKQLKVDLEDKMHESFEDIGTIHYARWLLIDYDTEHNAAALLAKPKLVFSSDFDYGVEQHLTDLCTKACDVIDRIYENCEGYPAEGARNPDSRRAYLNKWIVPCAAFYRGSPGRSLVQIRQESALRDFIRNHLNTTNYGHQTSKQVQAGLRSAVLANPGLSWVNEKSSLPKINIIGTALLVMLLVLLSPIIIIWVLIVQFGYERHDAYFTEKRSQLNDYKISRLEQYEDIELQNQFSQLVMMKPGKVRLITFKAMMLFSRTLIKLVYVKGKLLGIPSIHFARWVLFDNNKRVIFFSNFDGSWMQYLGDFIDQSGWGLTGIWSNTKLFPRTNFLLTKGAYDAEHFLAWSRYHQIPTQVWYCAYPNLSIKNVMNNTHIRNEVMQDLSEQKAQRFLTRI